MRPDKADEGVVESVHRNKPARALSYNDWPLIHPLQCVSVTVLDAAYVGKGGMQHIHTYIYRCGVVQAHLTSIGIELDLD